MTGDGGRRQGVTRSGPSKACLILSVGTGGMPLSAAAGPIPIIPFTQDVIYKGMYEET